MHIVFVLPSFLVFRQIWSTYISIVNQICKVRQWSCRDIWLKLTDPNLLLALKGKSEDHQVIKFHPLVKPWISVTNFLGIRPVFTTDSWSSEVDSRCITDYADFHLPTLLPLIRYRTNSVGFHEMHLGYSRVGKCFWWFPDECHMQATFSTQDTGNPNLKINTFWADSWPPDFWFEHSINCCLVQPSNQNVNCAHKMKYVII